MIISLIVAMDERGGIGKNNQLPWRLSGDLKRFKELTMGHHLIMGRKTFESIGRPLPGRTMIVLTRDPNWQAEGCLAAKGIDEALEMARLGGESEVFIIGGGDIFSQVLEMADRLYLTQVQAEVQADTFFPTIDEANWVEKQAEYQPRNDKNQYPFIFRILERKAK